MAVGVLGCGEFDEILSIRILDGRFPRAELEYPFLVVLGGLTPTNRLLLDAWEAPHYNPVSMADPSNQNHVPRPGGVRLTL
jgi:hypothetical protein